jgi:tetratricopeptide (TPR) repeat protein
MTSSLWLASVRGRVQLDPSDDKPQYQLISARAGLQEPELPIASYERSVALAPGRRSAPRYAREAKAGFGDPEGALADWSRALELEPEDIGALYSSAFLLERERRPAAAADAWRSVIEWNESRGLTLQSEWPKRELARLRTANAVD